MPGNTQLFAILNGAVGKHIVCRDVVLGCSCPTPLKAQVICHGKSYISAVQKMQRALCGLSQLCTWC